METYIHCLVGVCRMETYILFNLSLKWRPIYKLFSWRLIEWRPIYTVQLEIYGMKTYIYCLVGDTQNGDLYILFSWVCRMEIYIYCLVGVCRMETYVLFLLMVLPVILVFLFISCIYCPSCCFYSICSDALGNPFSILSQAFLNPFSILSQSFLNPFLILS